MKLDLKKVIIPTLAIAIGAAIVGSVSGTVAWYQYSTRVSTAYLGTTAGTAGNLKLRIKGDTDDTWLNSLTKEKISKYLEDNNLSYNIIPITAGDLEADAAIKTYNAAADNEPEDLRPLFFKNPIRSFEERVDYSSPSWLKADNSMYVQIPLEVAFIEFDGIKKGEEDKEYLEKDVYISDLLIQEDWQNDADQNNHKEDLSSAIRVHVSSRQLDENNEVIANSESFDRLISKNGGTILTEGYLDLDGDTKDDEYVDGDRAAGYGFGNSASIAANSKKVIYGEGLQTAYSAETDVKSGAYRLLDADADTAEKIYPAVVKSVNNSMVLDESDFKYKKEGASEDTYKSIGKTIGYDKTKDNWEKEYLNVTLTIWLEGWQELPVSPANPDVVSPIWNAADYIGSMFDVGVQFAVQAE